MAEVTRHSVTLNKSIDVSLVGLINSKFVMESPLNEKLLLITTKNSKWLVSALHNLQVNNVEQCNINLIQFLISATKDVENLGGVMKGLGKMKISEEEVKSGNSLDVVLETFAGDPFVYSNLVAWQTVGQGCGGIKDLVEYLVRGDFSLKQEFTKVLSMLQEGEMKDISPLSELIAKASNFEPPIAKKLNILLNMVKFVWNTDEADEADLLQYLIDEGYFSSVTLGINLDYLSLLATKFDHLAKAISSSSEYEFNRFVWSCIPENKKTMRMHKLFLILNELIQNNNTIDDKLERDIRALELILSSTYYNEISPQAKQLLEFIKFVKKAQAPSDSELLRHLSNLFVHYNKHCSELFKLMDLCTSGNVLVKYNHFLNYVSSLNGKSNTFNFELLTIENEKLLSKDHETLINIFSSEKYSIIDLAEVVFKLHSHYKIKTNINIGPVIEMLKYMNVAQREENFKWTCARFLATACDKKDSLKEMISWIDFYLDQGETTSKLDVIALLTSHCQTQDIMELLILSNTHNGDPFVIRQILTHLELDVSVFMDIFSNFVLTSENHNYSLLSEYLTKLEEKKLICSKFDIVKFDTSLTPSAILLRLYEHIKGKKKRIMLLDALNKGKSRHIESLVTCVKDILKMEDGLNVGNEESFELLLTSSLGCHFTEFPKSKNHQFIFSSFALIMLHSLYKNSKNTIEEYLQQNLKIFEGSKKFPAIVASEEFFKYNPPHSSDGEDHSLRTEVSLPMHWPVLLQSDEPEKEWSKEEELIEEQIEDEPQDTFNIDSSSVSIIKSIQRFTERDPAFIKPSISSITNYKNEMTNYIDDWIAVFKIVTSISKTGKTDIESTTFFVSFLKCGLTLLVRVQECLDIFQEPITLQKIFNKDWEECSQTLKQYLSRIPVDGELLELFEKCKIIGYNVDNNRELLPDFEIPATEYMEKVSKKRNDFHVFENSYSVYDDKTKLRDMLRDVSHPTHNSRPSSPSLTRLVKINSEPLIDTTRISTPIKKRNVHESLKKELDNIRISSLSGMSTSKISTETLSSIKKKKMEVTKTLVDKKTLDSLLQKANISSHLEKIANNTEEAKVSAVDAYSDLEDIIIPEKDFSKSTYALLANLPTIVELRKLLVTIIRSQNSEIKAPIENQFCLLVDNSGSMSGEKSIIVRTLLVIFLETLKRLECSVSVLSFGRVGSQKVLKPLDTEIDIISGEKVLEALTFDEGTNPVDGLRYAVNNGFKKSNPDSNESKKEVLRSVIMFTDGFTSETIQKDYISVLPESSSLSFIQISDPKSSNISTITSIKVALEKISSNYVLIDKNSLNATGSQNLSQDIGKLLINEFKRGNNTYQSISSSILQSINNVKPFLLDTKLDLKDEHNQFKLKPQDPKIENFDILKYRSMINASSKSLPSSPLLTNTKIHETIEETFKTEVGEKRANDIISLLETIDEQLLEKQDIYLYNQEYLELLSLAESWWNQLESKCEAVVEGLVEVLKQELMPINKFTKKKPDFKGSSFHMKSVIRYVLSHYNYKKIFLNTKSGGKHVYNVSLLIDVSMSTNGIIEHSNAISLCLMIIALNKMGIETFSVIGYGRDVHILKSNKQSWDNISKCNVLQFLSLGFKETASRDADAIDIALAYISRETNKDNSFVFNFTDGYGTQGLNFFNSLKRANEMNIKVIGILTGSTDRHGVKNYENWITSLTVYGLAEAITTMTQDLKAKSNALKKESSENEESLLSDLLTTSRSTGSLEDIWKKHTPMFEDLLGKIEKEKQFYVNTTKEREGTLSLDLCLVLDCTGSMSSYITGAKTYLKEMITKIINKLNEEQSSACTVRVGFVAYRDHCDGLDRIRSTKGFKKHQKEGINPIDSVIQLISAQTASGGGDGPEDVLGGLHEAVNFNWESTSRRILLLADAPCHGEKYNGLKSGDDYPNGDPLGLTFEGIFKSMVEKTIDLTFVRLHNYTDGMTNKIQSELAPNAGLKYEQLEFSSGADVSKLFCETIVSSILDDIIKNYL